jgi:hypothetical protein
MQMSMPAVLTSRGKPSFSSARPGILFPGRKAVPALDKKLGLREGKDLTQLKFAED